AAGLLYVIIVGLLLKLQGLAERKAKRLMRQE
ncbi:MAG: amino acid ABC transporter permease, partial [Klebsiella michiganensis]|nr:amino acid ABC transporter permease [Klebsiella michiganensis]MDU4436135.1 amino acid ABC transporter permease [Pluralibacter gergoviae]